MSAATITPHDLGELLKSGQPIELVDVRTPAEFREVHLEAARNVPLDQFDPQTVIGSRRSAEAPLYVVCKSGGRSRQACEKLLGVGFTQVVNVEGGTMACEQAGLPVARGKKSVISLERQVRIGAGSLVLLGIILGALVHPYLYGLSAFVGAGLVFAGVTDTCGMGIVLSRMPWNR